MIIHFGASNGITALFLSRALNPLAATNARLDHLPDCLQTALTSYCRSLASHECAHLFRDFNGLEFANNPFSERRGSVGEVQSTVARIQSLYQQTFAEGVPIPEEVIHEIVALQPALSLEFFHSGTHTDLVRLMILQHWQVFDLPAEDECRRLLLDRATPDQD